MGGESAYGCGWRERLCSVVVVRGGRDGLEAEAQCGDDSVVENVADVGLGGEEAEGGGVVL
ncbi:hypothetical protein RBB78_16515 [Tunturiibacter empetritectus]|uniref:hypothetical protein n=1 Tax=Tunturiibacter empetritectus TaxID=3069691 RepID=UPI003D9B06C2